MALKIKKKVNEKITENILRGINNIDNEFKDRFKKRKYYDYFFNFYYAEGLVMFREGDHVSGSKKLNLHKLLTLSGMPNSVARDIINNIEIDKRISDIIDRHTKQK